MEVLLYLDDIRSTTLQILDHLAQLRRQPHLPALPHVNLQGLTVPSKPTKESPHRVTDRMPAMNFQIRKIVLTIRVSSLHNHLSVTISTRGHESLENH